MDLVDSKGRSVHKGAQIGSGGEGAVYEVPAIGNDVVAKVYHQTVSAVKQAKLQAMVAVGNDKLRKIAAWPLETLHSSGDKQLRGFLMSRLTDFEPIHHLYSPSHRKQRFPDKSWAFLVYAARNVAAAFEAIHSHGHVIGDVNPNLVFVTGNSIVKLIDCDSFQIAVDGKHYFCEVGVPHFTPPELQKLASFRGVRRTRNHDNFGLALLLFHILLMGRHPFSGVYAGQGDMPLEKSIAEFRYAFGRNAAGKGMRPPPNSMTPEMLPAAVAGLFERAFTEPGAHPEGRPHAKDWVVALDALKSQLFSCMHNPVHKYFAGLASCPWCAQEQGSGNSFFIALNTGAVGQSSFNVESLWAKILLIETPGPVPEIDLKGLSIKAKPLLPALRSGKVLAMQKKHLAVGLVLGSLVFAPKLLLIALAVGGYLFFSKPKDFAERQARQAALTAARQHLAVLQKQWQLEAGSVSFHTKFNELQNLKTAYENWADNLHLEKEKLHQNLYDAQLQKFLNNFFLESFNIPGVGAARKVILASFGIETAADVTLEKVVKIKGFGEDLAREIVAWRKGLEKRFLFDASKGVDPADVAAVNQRFTQQRKQSEASLLAGPEDLRQLRGQILQKRAELLPVMQAAYQRVLQAEADLAVLS